jgi:hypothetical protein
MIELLPQERWPELADVFRREFDAELPHPTAQILADIDENDGTTIKGFVVMEFIGRIGQVWQTGGRSREMLERFNTTIPPGNSVIAIADKPRFEGLCRAFGMRELEGKVFRKDF